ncbi:hypothetical protein ACE01N_09825 [Saccharicrinis sp. FJH2]|uniref:hypothetical protein n=1 Tax=Saccharicrinis sp. FJH65 TaxID=3344659 RepID=UPI0035F3213F
MKRFFYLLILFVVFTYWKSFSNTKINTGEVNNDSILISGYIDSLKFIENDFDVNYCYIDYNDLMYKIAEYKLNAIPILLKSVKNNCDLNFKKNVLLTIYLIGTDGYQYKCLEKFKNKEARDAILEFLTYDDLRMYVYNLLVRDPKISDVPVLMKYMCDENNLNRLLNLLDFYDFESFPFNIYAMKTLFSNIPCKMIPYKYSHEGNITDIYLIKKNNSRLARLSKSIIKSPEWKNIHSDPALSNPNDSILDLELIMNMVYKFKVGSLSDYFFDYDGQNLYIHDVHSARDLWIAWYENNKNLIDFSDFKSECIK